MSSSGTVQPNWGSSASASASSSAARPPRSSTLQGGTSRGSGRGNFTARMQDRQARNKNPRTGLVDSDDSYTHDDDDEDEEGEGDDNDEYDDDDEEGRLRAMKKPTRPATADDAYEAAQRRREAALVLDNPELLMMHAESRQDSLAGTRHHFTKILCGYETPAPPPPFEEARALRQQRTGMMRGRA